MVHKRLSSWSSQRCSSSGHLTIFGILNDKKETGKRWQNAVLRTHQFLSVFIVRPNTGKLFAIGLLHFSLCALSQVKK